MNRKSSKALMLKKMCIAIVYILIIPIQTTGQQYIDFTKKIDSLITNPNFRSFNGQILISKNDSILYLKTQGYSELAHKVKITNHNLFVIGSLTKQITAVLILQAVDKGELKLTDTIANFLPNLTSDWSKTITIHHLLNHTHGIQTLHQPLKFATGTGFEYSNLGYQLLGEILEKVTGKKYAQLTTDLFHKIGMNNSIDPTISDKKNLATGFSQTTNSPIKEQLVDFENAYIPAGFLLSNAVDLAKWNTYLHAGKLVSDKSYQQLIAPTAEQNHSLFGTVGYAYGLRISNEEKIVEIGHTGYVPGYISMAFYYPESEATIIVLENFDFNDDDIKKTFYFELEIRKIIRNSSLIK
tara:strand:- start:2341 stop:3402 length:1062 start_codon:yes stop_codon:yes gene_type:complete